MSVCPDCGHPWMPPHSDRACGSGPRDPEPKLELRLGATYENGVNEQYTMTGLIEEGSFEYKKGFRFESRGAGRSAYRTDGTFELDGKPSRFDLVKEVDQNRLY
jgi:hypothetical protein